LPQVSGGARPHHHASTHIPTIPDNLVVDYKEQEDHLRAALHDIAADPRQSFSGWQRRFTLEQFDLLENIFQPFSQVQWDDLINPLWTELEFHGKKAWLALNSGLMHPDEERLPLTSAYLVPRQAHLRWIAFKSTCVNRNSLRRPNFRLPPLLAFLSLGRYGKGGYGILPALNLRLQCYPSY